MSFPDFQKDTQEHMRHLTPGDRYSEMLNYWIWLETVDELGVVALEIHAGSGDTWTRRVWPSAEAFRKTFAYGPIPGYWVHWVDNKPLSHLT